MVAAFLASIGTSIVGLNSDNEIIVVAGVICSTVSAAIYAASEAYVDGHAVASDTKEEKIIVQKSGD